MKHISWEIREISQEVRSCIRSHRRLILRDMISLEIWSHKRTRSHERWELHDILQEMGSHEINLTRNNITCGVSHERWDLLNYERSLTRYDILHDIWQEIDLKRDMMSLEIWSNKGTRSHERWYLAWDLLRDEISQEIGCHEMYLTRDDISCEISHERWEMRSCKRSHFSLEMSVGMRSQERDDLSRGMISKENEIYLEMRSCKK